MAIQFAKDEKVLLIPNKDSLYDTTDLRKIESKKELLKIEGSIMKVDGYIKLLNKHFRKNPFNSTKLDKMPKLDKDLSEMINELKLAMPENFSKIYNEYVKHETELLEAKMNDVTY